MFYLLAAKLFSNLKTGSPLSVQILRKRFIINASGSITTAIGAIYLSSAGFNNTNLNVNSDTKILNLT